MRALALALALIFPSAARSQELPQPPAVTTVYPSEAEQAVVRQRDEVRRQARMRVARMAAAEGDILLWGKALFPDKFGLPFCTELHGYFVSIRGQEFTNTEAPRGHAKTTIKCFLIPLYQALVEPLTFRHYLNVQATSTKADTVNSAIKLELEENAELRELYGEQVSKTKWTESQFVLNNGVVFTAVGANQSIKGINYRNTRPDYIIVDDLYDEEDLNNPVSTEKKNDWFWGSLYKARAIGRRTSLHMQGTAVNNYDLLEVLKKKPRWVSKTFKAVADADKKIILWKELDGVALADLLADIEDMPTVIFNREMQNERRDDAESIVKKDWLKAWLFKPSELRFDANHILVSTELGVDPSVGKTMLADFTGMAHVLKTRHADQPEGVYNYYIVALRNEHLSLNKRVQAVDTMAKAFTQWPEPRASIEGIAAFEDFVGEVRRKTNLKVNGINQVKDKITNLENKSGYFENGRVFLSEDIDVKLRDMLVYQLTNNFPKNDDLRDALLLVLPDLKPRGSWRPV